MQLNYIINGVIKILYLLLIRYCIILCNTTTKLNLKNCIELKS